MSSTASLMGWRLGLVGIFLTFLAGLVASGLRHDGVGQAGAVQEPPFEVWAVDQQDTRSDGGGLLYIYDGPQLAGKPAAATPEVIDLGGAVRDLCLARTGTAPRRPHMLTFNGGDYDLSPSGNTHAALSFVVSGHVVFFDAATRTALECIDVGVQAHAVWPTPDQGHLVVADQNGRKLHRIFTDYQASTFVLETSFDLAGCVTPSGANCTIPLLRDDNAPICPRVDASNQFTFVTLRGGGLFVLDHNSTPMRIVAEYDRSTIWTGCGAGETAGKMYLNSGSLPARPSGHDLYVFNMSEFSLAGTPPNTPAPTTVYSRTSPTEEFDSHGVAFTKHHRYLWVNDRIQNDVTVVDVETDAVVERFSLEGALSSDPAPDIFDLSPGGNQMFVTLRGPTPQSGGHAAIGSTPGLGVIEVLEAGRSGKLTGIARLPEPQPGVAPDPHGIRVRHIRGP